MYAVKLRNGDVQLVAVVPADAVDSFEFDIASLPKETSGLQDLVVDFGSKSFSLKKREKPFHERFKDMEAENKLLKAQVAAQSEQLDFYEECIVELANQVYA